MSKYLTIPASILGLLACASPASAGIVGVAGPAQHDSSDLSGQSLGDGQYESWDVLGFDELQFSISVDDATCFDRLISSADIGATYTGTASKTSDGCELLAEGDYQSHLLHFDAPVGTTLSGATFIFDGDIVGVIYSATNLADSDSLFGTAADYSTLQTRKLESGDLYSIDNSNQLTLATVKVNNTSSDQIRVITAITTATADEDGDGVPDDEDACPGYDDTADGDADGTADGCDDCPLDADNDADGDGFCADEDNCPTDYNADQADADLDLVGDICDDDDDGDGVDDLDDNCPLHDNADQIDTDGNGAGDACDADDDGDGIDDDMDQCQATSIDDLVDDYGCSVAQICPCDNSWRNHGAYVSCVSHTANDWVDDGLISETELGDYVSAAAPTSCGKKSR